MWTILKHTGLLMLLALLSLSAKADEAAELQRFVTENTDMMVARLEAERDTYYKDPEQFYAVMQDVTESFVDFRRIAARVMGRYAR
ncbi:MAG: ABC transporter substrate-binding protein, partial [Gammaproteobacteria bacterium]|nr:ABC transporter substrate-binding protein [Gammaproteobacteria bacterium]